MRPIKAEESIGKKYGKLTVLRLAGEHITPNGRKFKRAECLCECGRKKVVNIADLRSGKTKTCGLDHPHYTDRSMPAFNQLYDHSYKKRSIAKGLPFELTKEQFMQFTKMNCHYCGAEPGFNGTLNTRWYPRGKGQSKVKSGNVVSTYLYNGLDRVDSSKGYTVGNVVPCCGVCNHAKHTMPYEAFQAWISRLVNHNADRRRRRPVELLKAA